MAILAEKACRVLNPEQYIVITGGGWFRRGRKALPGLRDYLHSTWVETVCVALTFVSGMLVTRGLGPTGRGQLAAALMWPQVVGLLISLGLQPAFAYAVGAGWASPERLRRLALRYTLLVGFSAMVVYWFLCPLIFHKQFPNEIWIARVLAPFIPVTLCVSLLLPIYQGSGDFRIFNGYRLFRNGGWALWVVLLTATAGLTVLNLLLVQLLNSIVLVVLLLSQLGRLKERNKNESTVPTKAIFTYGFAVYLSYLTYSVNQSLDQLLLSLRVAPSELGQYAAAVSVSSLILLVPSAVGPIVFSKMARVSDEKLQQQRHLRHALLVTLASLVPVGVGLVILGPWIARLLYGAAFVPAGQLLRVLSPAAMLLGIWITLSDSLRGAGKPMYVTYGAVVGGVVTILGLVWALPRYGIWGAAWVSLIAYGVMLLVQTFFVFRWTAAKVETQP